MSRAKLMNNELELGKTLKLNIEISLYSINGSQHKRTCRHE
ncbi:hypothetical protein VCHA54O482_10973 [Vibrio chagasii]|nr:hypothetical protein VCHA35P150_10064 [Vibrio chagasii]CAH6862948.1 hypothetical protein VCHA31O71_10980 [Vibrio chagasii]CAH7026616.1 hypothetical protein VCHA43P275_10064 [Vibrio chagasii]CAH7087570.1 hypothetical protein VCHA37P199_10149 [Vibrio chagasii]CAH7149798.1 hypothetical protein VCHA53O473_10492 [Vibrio chagasii]